VVSHFRGTAWYYARFRPPYPPELIAQLAAAAGLGPASRVLDLACGTGPIAIPLAAHAGEVVAVDVEDEMLEELRASAPPNVTTVHADAHDVDAGWGRFDLVTIGRALHWLGGGAFLARLEPVTDQVALLGEGFEDSVPRDVVRNVARRFVGERPPAPGDDVVYAEALAGSVFDDVVTLDFEHEREWTPDTLVGLAYSTSQASPLRLGDRREDFERELRASLEARYVERGSMQALLGRRRKQ
jgi:SAM-dependent methyltransferase